MEQSQSQTSTNSLDLPQLIPIIGGVGQLFRGQAFLEFAVVTSWIYRNRILSIKAKPKKPYELPDVMLTLEAGDDGEDERGDT